MPGTDKKPKPLLYVFQPKLAPPVLKMQNSYSIKPNPKKQDYKGPAEDEGREEILSELNTSPQVAIDTDTISVLKERMTGEVTEVPLPKNEATLGKNSAAEKLHHELSGVEEELSPENETAITKPEASIPVTEEIVAISAEVPTSIGTEKEELSIKASPDETESPKPAFFEKANPFIRKRNGGNSLRRVKHFKEMSIEEKLSYIIHFPKQLPPMAFTYTTGKLAYSGILVNHADDQIDIQLFDGGIKTIKIVEITRIKMAV